MPYRDYACAVYDCAACGCRFTEHSSDVYERLHGQSASSYARHDALAQQCSALFHAGDAEGLRRLLLPSVTRELVMNALECLEPGARVLEVGCSKGALASYFLALGHDVLGVDVSESAIARARELFGDHFELPGGPREAGPFDAIYHTGTIGCVADPVGMTRGLLQKLKPGGQLVFNSPNARACRRRGQLWLSSTAPPDLVTLFQPGFWRERFDDLAEAHVEEIRHEPATAWVEEAVRVVGPRWRLRSRGRVEAVEAPTRDRRRWLRERVEHRLRRLPLPTIDVPTDFGIHVCLTRRADGGQGD